MKLKLPQFQKLKSILIICLVIFLVFFICRPVQAQVTVNPTGNFLKDVAINTFNLITNPIGYTKAVAGMAISSTVYHTMSYAAYAFGYLGAQILMLESKILTWVVDMSSFTKMPVVQIGWKIVRDFTNLFFIAILIYIAFATILRIGSYSAKKILWKVVVIAILINFSLMLSGIIIDFSQMMFKYFIFSVLPDGQKDASSFSLALANALRIQTFWAPSADELATTVGETIVGFLGKMIFVITFIFVAVIVLGALVFILLIRNFWLWILLILAPIAWFCWIVPVPLLAQYWKQWWQNFLKWAFMAPIIGFFIFLAFAITLQGQQKLQEEKVLPSEQVLQEMADNSLFSYGNKEASVFNPLTIMQIGLVIGFLIAGLMAGESLGSKTAKGALGLINKSGKWAQKRMLTKPATRLAGGISTGISKGLSKIPLVGGAFSKPFGVAGRGFQAKAEAIKKEERAKAGKRLEGKSLSDLDRDWKTLTENEKFATVEKALKEGKIPDNMKAKAMEMAEKGQISKTGLLKIDPTLRRDWQEPMKRNDTEKLQNNIAEDFKGKSATEVSKTIASVDFSKESLLPLAEAFVNNMADNPKKYNSYVVMNIVDKKKEASEKDRFVELLIRAKMKSKHVPAAATTDAAKLDFIESDKGEADLVKKLNDSPGLKKIESTYNDIRTRILGLTKKPTPPEEKGPIITPPPAHGGPGGAPAALPPHFPPPPPPSGWQPPPPLQPRPREPWTPADTGPRPETFRPQRPTREIREQTRENPPEK